MRNGDAARSLDKIVNDRTEPEQQGDETPEYNERGKMKDSRAKARPEKEERDVKNIDTVTDFSQPDENPARQSRAEGSGGLRRRIN